MVGVALCVDVFGGVAVAGWDEYEHEEGGCGGVECGEEVQGDGGVFGDSVGMYACMMLASRRIWFGSSVLLLLRKKRTVG